MADNQITAEIIRTMLVYDPETGLFRWTQSVGRCAANAIAGRQRSDGYVGIKVNKFDYRAHRLAWLYMTGKLPHGDIDHINGVRNDNRWNNLRQVTRSQNLQNQRAPHRDSRSPYLGVSWYPLTKRWTASICLAGKCIHLGYFASAEEAAEVYQAAKRRLHPVAFFA